MITLTILLVIAIIMTLAALFVGASVLLVFGDLIVAILVLRVIFGLIFKRKEEEDLD